jgi:hypothetical protein
MWLDPKLSRHSATRVSVCCSVCLEGAQVGRLITYAHAFGGTLTTTSKVETTPLFSQTDGLCVQIPQKFDFLLPTPSIQFNLSALCYSYLPEVYMHNR